MPSPIPGTTIVLDEPYTEADLRSVEDVQADYAALTVKGSLERSLQHRRVEQLSKAPEPTADPQAIPLGYVLIPERLLRQLQGLLARTAARPITMEQAGGSAPVSSPGATAKTPPEARPAPPARPIQASRVPEVERS